MKTVTVSLAAAMAALLGGCVLISTTGSTSSAGRTGEGLYGSLVTASDTVVITARSGGCTSKDSFRADTKLDDGVHEVTFTRLRPDLCKALVIDGVELTWTFAELGVPAGARVIVTNRSQR